MTPGTPHRQRSTMRRLRGTTLIEVLIAIVVLAIGLLGMAGLQMQSLRSNLSAHMRSQATLMAADVADRARTRGRKSLALYLDGSDDADRTQWDAEVAALFGPGAVASVTNPAGSLLRISISWADDRGCIKDDTGECTEANAGAQTFVYETVP